MARISPFAAIPALETLGYFRPNIFQHDRCKYWYMETPNGLRNVKVVPRRYDKAQRNGQGRYFVGISIPLFDVVDEWVLFLRGEPWLYVIDNAFLSGVWRTERCLPRRHDKQWPFSFCPDTGYIETPHISLLDYRHDLN